jgi:hypothetical protein
VSCDGDELTRVWLAVQLQQLWAVAGADASSACEEFDRLVAEYGRWRVARAMADLGLLNVPNQRHG